MGRFPACAGRCAQLPDAGAVHLPSGRVDDDGPRPFAGRDPVTASGAGLRPMLEFLLGAGLVERIEDTRLAPLTGGVSSDIWLVTEGGRQIVVKQPLADLKVA